MERLEGSRGKMVNIPIPDAEIELDETEKTFLITEDVYFKTDQPYFLSVGRAMDHAFIPGEGKSLYIAEVERLQDSMSGILIWPTGEKGVGTGFKIRDMYKDKDIGKDISYVFAARPESPGENMFYFYGVMGEINSGHIPNIDLDTAVKILKMYAEAHGIKPAPAAVMEAIWQNINLIVVMVEIMDEVKTMEIDDPELRVRIRNIMEVIEHDPQYDLYRKMADHAVVEYSPEKLESYIKYIRDQE